MTPWEELGLGPVLLEAVASRGYESPTPVQVEAVPAALDGHDLLVRSKTGTGKTAAFMIPTIAAIPDGYRKPGCIVLCPTRELAIQIAEEAELLAKGRDLSVIAVYGGVKIGPQTTALQAGAEIVVGTPGRVMDHIRRGNLKLGEAKVGVFGKRDLTAETAWWNARAKGFPAASN